MPCPGESLPSPVPSSRSPQSGGASPAVSAVACSERVKMATATLFLEGRDFCRSLEGRDFCLPVRLSEDCAVTGPRAGAWARLGGLGVLPGASASLARAAAAPAPSWGVACSPPLSALLCPVLSPPGPTGCGWETLTRFFEGNAAEHSAGAHPPSPPEGPGHFPTGSLQAGLPPGWSPGHLCASVDLN